jgi:PAS domain S-box-containing protein
MQIWSHSHLLLKYFLAIFVTGLCFLCTLWFFYNKYELNHEKQRIARQAASYLAINQQKLNDTFRLITKDLLTLARTHEHKLTGNDASQNKDLLHDFLAYSNGNKIYDQIRYIDETGQELIRINYNQGKPAVVPKEQLQNKANRYYFTDTISLEKGEIFISPLDLNVEHGLITKPIKPMMRFGTPVFDHLGIKKGILLLNYYGDHLLSLLDQTTTWDPGFLILLNNQGYWLKSNIAREAWGFMYEKQSLTFSNRFPSFWEQMSNRNSGYFFSPDGLLAYTTIFPMEEIRTATSSTGSGRPFDASVSPLDKKGYSWKMVYQIPSETIQAITQNHRSSQLLLFLPLIVIIIISSMALAILLVKQHASHEVLVESKRTLAALLAESNRTQEALQEKTTTLDNILHSAKAVAIATTDMNFVITYYNRMAEKFFGYAAAEVIGKTVMEVHLMKDVEAGRFEHAIDIVHQEGEYCFSLTQQTDDGVRELDSTVAGIFDVDHNLTGYSLFSYDVTEHKQQKRELERLQTAIDQTSETVVITDSEGAIQYVNPAFEKLTGYTADEAIGNNPSVLKSGKHPTSFYENMWLILKRGEVWRSNLINKKKDGSLFEEEASISPVMNAEGQIINFIAVKRDVSKEVILEQQLRQAAKMEAIGTLTGGIAHDFNNILTGILGYAQLMQAKVAASDPIQEDLEQVVLAGKRAVGLVGQLLTFSRQGEVLPRKPLRIQPIIREVLQLVRAALPATIQIKEKLVADKSLILADPTQIHQLLKNIIINSKHAMGDDPGTLTVSLVKTLFTVSCQPDNCPALKPGSYFDLCISDTGCGMDESIQEKIFEPFFTTKRAGQGTGLGMSVVHGIVKSHEAEITVSSAPQQGTTFHIYLPVIEDVPRLSKQELFSTNSIT